MRLVLIAILAITGCVEAQAGGETALPLDEAALAPDFSKMDWVLTAIDDQPAGFNATMNLGEAGRAVGQAPCNRYSAAVTRQGTVFQFGPIAATRMACDQLKEEMAYFELLAKVTSAEGGYGFLTLKAGTHRLQFAQPID